jgi:hypothetical protein
VQWPLPPCLLGENAILKTPTGKQPHYYTARDSALLTMAGRWDVNDDQRHATGEITR